MEGTSSISQQNNLTSIQSFKASLNYQVIQETFSNDSGDAVNINLGDSGKALSLTADEIVSRLNELLKDKLPDGLQSTRAEDNTPEATADRIFKSISGLF